MFELVAFCLIGILFGTITGLTPGLHVNTVCAIFLSLTLGLEPVYLVVLFFSMAITHTFLDFIPSILLGVPSEDTALGVLPGHELVLRGRGEEAIYLTLLGSMGCLVLGIFLIPFFMFFIPAVYSFLTPLLGYLLLFVGIGLAVRERYGLICFLLSGLLGLIVLNSPIKDPLLPLLTGLFGLSVIILSIGRDISIPPQISTNINIDRAAAAKGILSGSVAGAIVGFLPGFGPSQAAVLTQGLSQQDERDFLITLGGINTANALFALVALITIHKTRSGVVNAISEIFPDFGFRELLILISCGVLTAGIAFYVGIRLSKIFPNLVRKLDYKKLNCCVAAFIIGLVFLLSGFYGLLVLLVSTLIGLVPHFYNARKMHLMGVLIVPTALWFLGF